jgi:hypothetical protein
MGFNRNDSRPRIQKNDTHHTKYQVSLRVCCTFNLAMRN